ncbi:MAG: ABC transporter ATP-binding protein, partial [Bacteroidaceae bacterium]|nr:ABC transporter ATP-binding protein [Bacteroidaceae bacterium]
CVQINGISPSDRNPELMREMFLVPEEYDLPAIRLKEYVKLIKPFYPKFSEKLMEDCLSCFDMNSNVNLAALSMGQKKKVYMCLAFASNTSFLFMDEPTNGLDILSKSQCRKAIIRGMNPGKTIIIGTHQVHDVIIDRNKVLLNQLVGEGDEPVSLEKLFIDTLTHSAL